MPVKRCGGLAACAAAGARRAGNGVQPGVQGSVAGRRDDGREGALEGEGDGARLGPQKVGLVSTGRQAHLVGPARGVGRPGHEGAVEDQA